MKNYQFDAEVALSDINYIQELFKNIKKKINQMKAELGKVGFEVEFDSSPFGDETVRCTVRKKGDKRPFLEQFAEVAESDYPVPLLGEYLSLARATRIVLGDYNA